MCNANALIFKQNQNKLFGKNMYFLFDISPSLLAAL